MKILCVMCLIFVGDISFINRGDAKFIRVDQCVKSVKNIETKEDFMSFAHEAIPGDEEYLTKLDIAIINKCLNSMNGQRDIKALMEIIEEASNTDTLCEQWFVDQFVSFTEQMADNSNRCWILATKKTNRLTHFFKSFTSEVFLVCENMWSKPFYKHYRSALSLGKKV